MVLNKLRKIVEDSTIDFDSIEAIRRNYTSVCQQISCVNSCFKYYTFTVYVTGLPTLCFSTYELHFAWTSMDPGIKIGVCMVICTEAFMILLMTFAATLVGHAVSYLITNYIVRINHEDRSIWSMRSFFPYTYQKSSLGPRPGRLPK